MRILAAMLVLVVTACGSGRPQPADLDTKNDACAECRMTVSASRFASQVVAPGEDARFFDDLGCLAAYLHNQPALPAGAAVFVADHRTREWTAADTAVYTRVPGLETPMGSHVVAHATAASRDADTAIARGEGVDARSLFGGRLPEGRQ